MTNTAQINAKIEDTIDALDGGAKAVDVVGTMIRMIYADDKKLILGLIDRLEERCSLNAEYDVLFDELKISGCLDAKVRAELEAAVRRAAKRVMKKNEKRRLRVI